MKSDMVNTAIDNYVENGFTGSGYAILRYIRKGWIASTDSTIQKMIDNYPSNDVNGCHIGFLLLRASFTGLLGYSGE
jgi:hypothetical protein